MGLYQSGKKKDMLNQLQKMCMKGVICAYCKEPPVLVDSKIIYGTSYGKIWLCEKCDAYVGVHKGTEIPLGRLAKKDLREAKKEAHLHFDKLWKSGKMKRTQAYQWLSDTLMIDKEYTHIGMFNLQTCKKVVELSKHALISENLTNTRYFNR